MDEVGDWLERLGLSGYAAAFAENDIEFDLLPELTDADLEKLGVASLGHRKRLLKAISALPSAAVPLASTPPANAASEVPRPVSSDAERRQLTVMFCDLVGSVALSEQLDPEDLREIIHVYQRCCTGVSERFRSFIARYMGDGLLIYFGYPQAHEDDAERAIRAGLEIIQAVGELRPRIDLELQVRIGIATGQVVVGDYIGVGASEEMEVVGETPNLAARLQSIAEPGTVVIAPATRNLVGGLFEYEDLGNQDLKGISVPVRAWRVVGETVAESRFDAAHAAGMTPLVGVKKRSTCYSNAGTKRRTAIVRWSSFRARPGSASREYSEVSANAWRISFTIGCSTTARPIIKAAPSIRSFSNWSDACASRRKTMCPGSWTSWTPSWATWASRSWNALPPLADLLSLTAGARYPSPSLSAEEMKKRILEALFAMIEAMASQDPVLILVEDAHWIDPSTLELLNLLIEHLSSTRVLIVVTYRPEFDSTWDGFMHVTGLTLNRPEPAGECRHDCRIARR